MGVYYEYKLSLFFLSVEVERFFVIVPIVKTEQFHVEIPTR